MLRFSAAPCDGGATCSRPDPPPPRATTTGNRAPPSPTAEPDPTVHRAHPPVTQHKAAVVDTGTDQHRHRSIRHRSTPPSRRRRDGSRPGPAAAAHRGSGQHARNTRLPDRTVQRAHDQRARTDTEHVPIQVLGYSPGTCVLDRLPVSNAVGGRYVALHRGTDATGQTTRRFPRCQRMRTTHTRRFVR